MFAYVTPTVSVTLSDFGCSWEPLFLIHKLMFQPRPSFFFNFFFPKPRTDELKKQNQTSCLVYLEERDKCGFRLFQGMHINHASEGALGVGKGVGGGGGDGEGKRRRRRLSAGSTQPSLTSKTVKMSPSHPRRLGRAPALC